MRITLITTYWSALCHFPTPVRLTAPSMLAPSASSGGAGGHINKNTTTLIGKELARVRCVTPFKAASLLRYKLHTHEKKHDERNLGNDNRHRHRNSSTRCEYTARDTWWRKKCAFSTGGGGKFSERSPRTLFSCCCGWLMPCQEHSPVGAQVPVPLPPPFASRGMTNPARVSLNGPKPGFPSKMKG